jgi:hypothetical protein
VWSSPKRWVSGRAVSANELGKWIGSHARDPCRGMDAATRAALFGDAPARCDAGVARRNP